MCRLSPGVVAYLTAQRVANHTAQSLAGSHGEAFADLVSFRPWRPDLKRTLTISALVALALAVFAMSAPLPAEAGRVRSGRVFGSFPVIKGGVLAYIKTHSHSQPTPGPSPKSKEVPNPSPSPTPNPSSEPKPESNANPESEPKPRVHRQPRTRNQPRYQTPGPRPESRPNPDTRPWAEPRANPDTRPATNSVTLEEPAPLAGSLPTSAISSLRLSLHRLPSGPLSRANDGAVADPMLPG